MRNQGQVFKDGYIPPQQIVIHHSPAQKPHLHTYIFPSGSFLCCGLAVSDHIMSETHLWGLASQGAVQPEAWVWNWLSAGS